MKYIYDGDKFDVVNKNGETLRLNIYNDCEDFFDPRGSRDNVAALVCWHNSYSLGDSHSYDMPEDLLEYLLEYVGYSSKEIDALFDFDLPHKKMINNILGALNSKDIIIMPLYLYDHSGITISVSDFKDHFDSGCVGFAYITKEVYFRETGSTDKEHWKDLARQIICDEVELYDLYIRGEVYGFSLSKITHCPTCGHEEAEVIDAYGGFYGSEIHENGMLDCLPEEFKELFKEEN